MVRRSHTWGVRWVRVSDTSMRSIHMSPGGHANSALRHADSLCANVVAHALACSSPCVPGASKKSSPAQPHPVLHPL